MPSSSARRPGPAAARPRRPIGRGFAPAPAAPVRPVQAPFAAAFGVLVAVEDAWLGWFLWDADPEWGWYLALPALLSLAALAGAFLVLRGRPLTRWLSGSAVLALAAVPPLLFLLGLAGLFAVLGGGTPVLWALLLLVGPVGTLVLALGRPVREWSGARRAGRDGRPVGRSR